MFPNSGKTLRKSTGSISDREYANQISAALRFELGNSARATKTIMSWTDSSDRTARNWMNGMGGPSGPHLISLMRESPAILAVVLELSNRPELQLTDDLHAAEVALSKALGSLERLRRQRERAPSISDY